ncbi:unnamed protein product [Clonostachys rosea]|uniref:Heterokaryon incompatibility domain-containing protein n=1 Tax=Bionectria ochroleuca TaxID=29856 RepID=A0ABY6U4C1_BIOOC|nr:unnamed protein product [Clonostachys rosea]
MRENEEETRTVWFGNDEPHITHGHPLLNPGEEYWMKWSEWESGMVRKFQSNQIYTFDKIISPALEEFFKVAAAKGFPDLEPLTLPQRPSDEATFEKKQEYLIEAFNQTLAIALHDKGPLPKKERHLTQSGLGQYRVLYQRTKLDKSPTTFRMLELLPAERPDEPLETRLFTADLDNLGCTYEGLSYTWGTVTHQRELLSIRVNGLVQRVAPNLYHALSSLRVFDRSRFLWVDSLCINQDDVRECSQQVALMAKIYANAERTVIFLGQGSAATDAFASFLALPICQELRCKDCGVDHSAGYWRQLPREACQEAGLNEQDVLDGFIDICSRPWWSRVWVLQEYSLSTADPLFYCGDKTILNKTLERKFNDMYDWVSHKKHHPQPIDGCVHFACNPGAAADKLRRERMHERAKISQDDVSRQAKSSQGSPSGSPAKLKEPVLSVKGDAESDFNNSEAALGSPNSHLHPSNDSVPFAPKLQVVDQTPWGSMWSSWGSLVMKARKVLERRSMCSRWTSPETFYRSFEAHCTNPRDVVFGVRELMDPGFRDMFRPDYSISVSRLYTRLSAYLLALENWTEMLWFFPYRLRNSPDTPSWVRDFSRVPKIKSGEKRPVEKDTTYRTYRSIPQVIDRVLFVNGWMLDEIVHVFVLPEDDPFGVLQQLWYFERAFGRPCYKLFDGTRRAVPKNQDVVGGMLRKTREISLYPSIGWAVAASNHLPHDLSIVHLIEELADLRGIPELWDSWKLTIDHYLDTWWEAGEAKDIRRQGLFKRTFALWHDILYDKWQDFVGISTFDLEGLRAQIRHRLSPTIPWKPPTVPGQLQPDSYTEDNIRCPRFYNAPMQWPNRYASILTAIEKGANGPVELRIRELLVIELAELVHDAAMHIVGGQTEVEYTNLGSSDERARMTTCERSKESEKGTTSSTGRKPISVINDFIMMPLPDDIASGRYDDGNDYWFSPQETSQEEQTTIRRFLNLRSKARNESAKGSKEAIDSHRSFAIQTRGSQGEDAQNQSELPSTLNPTLANSSQSKISEEPDSLSRVSTKSSNEGITNPPEHPQPDDHELPNTVWSRWRRVERRTGSEVHFLLKDVTDFLAGRELFVTRSRQVGLTGPGTHGVEDGDDVLLLRDMSLPIIGRLEPHQALGNPKKRRDEVPTRGMRREILGPCILRDLDPKGGDPEKVVFPNGFEPLSGLGIGILRFR